MVWASAMFIAVVAAVVFVQRRRLATLQALVLGGSILPGCVTAQAASLLLLAALLILAHLGGFI
jgi:hypothetical protein